MFGSRIKKAISKELLTSKQANTIEVKTIVGMDCKIQGNINSAHSLKVDGEITGDVVVKGDLLIGEKATINGNIECKHLVLLGTIKGDVKVINLDLKKTGSLIGKLTTVGLQIETGAVYFGEVQMQKDVASNVS